MDTWLVVLIGLQMAFVGLLIWIAVYYRIEKQRRRTEERIRLLERFETSEELKSFLASDSGRTYLEASATKRTDPRLALALTLGAAAVSTLLGIGSLIVTFLFPEHHDMTIPGSVLTSLGVGLFLAALFASLLLKRSGGTEAS
ncbi:MAG: hypothetical protein MI919_27885 [Holophagales bacterium]|nr:hypothetical protein [Holophagales bacterium]